MSNILTGIKPTGILHIGNYISTIKPIIETYDKNNNYYIMIADGHALTSQLTTDELITYTQQLHITLLSIFGDDPNIHIFRQSKIPEIFKLNWYLSCFTAKGLLNRNHSYKAMVQENLDKNKDPDKGIFMGLFNYPVLMASDILSLDVDEVPIGKDQEQHLELIIDIIEKMNWFYNTELFKIPEYNVKENIILNSYDGRKMSKSYKNTLPVVYNNDGELKKFVFKFKTNNKMEGEPKELDDTELSRIIFNICSNDSFVTYQKALISGKSWKEIKELSFELLRMELIKYYASYYYYLKNYDVREDILLKTEEEVRSKVQKNLKRIERIIGF